MVHIDTRSEKEKFNDDYFEKYGRYPPNPMEPFEIVLFLGMIGFAMCVVLINVIP
jgi:hypothetical protein